MLNISQSTANRRPRQESWLQRLRRFVDGEDVLVTMEETTAPRLRARDRFYKQLATQINDLLNQEAFGPPNVPLTLPTEIIINIAPDINALWLNQVRRRLVDGLEALIKERVKEMTTNSAVVRTVPPRVSLREDSNLDMGGVKLEPLWGETTKATSEYHDPEITQVYSEQTEHETTVVITPENPLYHLDVFHSGQFQRRLGITKQKATIGRPSRSSSVEVELFHASVSRVHAVLELEPTGLWLTAFGQNQTSVNGRSLKRRHRRQVRAGETIEICGFMLRIADESEKPAN